MTPKLLVTLLLAATTVLAENWPFWRGPSRQGDSKETGLPLHWSGDSNVLWKAEVPGEAWSSPIVYGDQVFVTTTTESGVNCHVLAYERTTGKLLWNKKVFEQTPLKKEQRNSYATPTPATDGERVYGVFGDGSVVALAASSGDILWEHRDVKFYSQHGLGASPILHGDLLIMPFDGSSTGENKRVGWQIPWDQAYLLAFDKKTGEVRWKATRGQSRIAHVSPNLMRQGGREILVSGAGDVVQGFNLQNGERLWSVYSQGEGVVPSIVVGEGLIYTVSGFEKPTLRAVKPPAGGEGEATIAWEQKKGVPMIPSLILAEKRLFGVTEGGVALCLDAESGEIVWQERIGGNQSASPVMAENRIYFLNEEGESTVIEASPVFKILARNNLKEKTQASMAVSQRAFFIRTEKNLFCIATR
jgi:outer membrane protein assembly factor BamB